MAGVGRGVLRPGQGGKQSIIVITLFVIIVILGANYWSLSSKHHRLIIDFERLHKTYKGCMVNVELITKSLNDKTTELQNAHEKLVDGETCISNLDTCWKNCTESTVRMQANLDDCITEHELIKNDEETNRAELCEPRVQQEVDRLKIDCDKEKQEEIEKTKEDCQNALKENKSQADQLTNESSKQQNTITNPLANVKHQKHQRENEEHQQQDQQQQHERQQRGEQQRGEQQRGEQQAQEQPNERQQQRDVEVKQEQQSLQKQQQKNGNEQQQRDIEAQQEQQSLLKQKQQQDIGNEQQQRDIEAQQEQQSPSKQQQENVNEQQQPDIEAQKEQQSPPKQQQDNGNEQQQRDIKAQQEQQSPAKQQQDNGNEQQQRDIKAQQEQQSPPKQQQQQDNGNEQQQPDIEVQQEQQSLQKQQLQDNAGIQVQGLRGQLKEKLFQNAQNQGSENVINPSVPKKKKNIGKVLVQKRSVQQDDAQSAVRSQRRFNVEDKANLQDPKNVEPFAQSAKRISNPAEVGGDQELPAAREGLKRVTSSASRTVIGAGSDTHIRVVKDGDEILLNENHPSANDEQSHGVAPRGNNNEIGNEQELAALPEDDPINEEDPVNGEQNNDDEVGREDLHANDGVRRNGERLR